MPPSGPFQPPGPYGAPPGYGYPGVAVAKAGFWARFAAYLIDPDGNNVEAVHHG